MSCGAMTDTTKHFREIGQPPNLISLIVFFQKTFLNPRLIRPLANPKTLKYCTTHLQHLRAHTGDKPKSLPIKIFITKHTYCLRLTLISLPIAAAIKQT
jgi:hypothetical protein